MNKRTKGKQGEEIAKQHYLNQGYTLIQENFTIRGGEIDLLMKKGKSLVAIEVKNLDSINELNNYIHKKKL
jgi:putative endonuclease